MMRAHKIRLNPTPEQEVYFRRACGTARFAYNWGLSAWKQALDAGEKTNWMALKKRLNAVKKAEFPWMYEVTKCATEAALSDLGSAMGNFISSKTKQRKGRKAGFPQFKKKGRSLDKFYVANESIRFEGRSIFVPKLGFVAMTEELRFVGKIMGATVSRTADHWFVSIQVQVEDTPVVHKSHVKVGVDLGLKTAVVTSTGKFIEAPKPLKKSLKKLARLNRRLHRKVLSSKNRVKAANDVARLHEKVANQRRDWLHKTTTMLARCYSFIAVEDLNVAGMMRNERMALAISDVGFGEFGRQMQYKVPAHGGTLVEIDRWFPSSKACRKCGAIKEGLTLKDRIYVCDSCGHVEDRDLNASKNILNEGHRTVGRTGTNACGQPASMPKRKRFGVSKLAEAGNNVNSNDLCSA